VTDGSTRAGSPRVVVVTGASSGIGLATAQRLAARGDRLVLSSRSLESLHRADESCRAAGAGATSVVPADVTDQDAVDSVLADALARFRRVDAWVNTAAVVAYGRFEEVPPDVFRRVLETNTLGSANVARTALRHFRSVGGGTLVLTGSLLGEITTPFMSPYAVSKWAVRGLGRLLDIENRDLDDVHVCVVSPGPVDTPIYRQAASYVGRVGRPPPPVDRADTVAAAMVRCLDDPRPRVSVGPLNPVVRLGFTALPWAFDRLVTPVMRLTGLSRQHTGPTPGNVFEPRSEQEQVSGGHGRLR
jgi:NAD(P)-dependent dehydrogenase (short-subunit alcohol dehydrogenase family)